jgi:hypothetical protein
MDAFDALPTDSDLITKAEAYRAMLQVMQYYYRLGHEEDQHRAANESHVLADFAATSCWI